MGGLHGEGIELFFVLGGWHTKLDLSLDFTLVFVASYTCLVSSENIRKPAYSYVCSLLDLGL